MTERKSSSTSVRNAKIAKLAVQNALNEFDYATIETRQAVR
jgi:hypothetical protein